MAGLEIRRWWIAGAASMLVPGLGQVYNGRLLRAILLCMIMLALPVMITVWILANGWLYIWLALPLLLLLIAHIIIITEATIDARRSPSPGPCRWFQRLWFYGVFTLLVAALLHAAQWMVIERAFETRKATVALSDLGVEAGDWLLINRIAFSPSALLRPAETGNVRSWRSPRPGDVVVVRRLAGASGDEVRYGRCLAVVGDRVELSDGVLKVGGFPVRTITERSISSGSGPGRQPSMSWPSREVDPGQVCVVGTATEGDLTEPFVGLVPLERIVGQPMLVLWSVDHEAGEVRRQRIGLPVL